MATASKVVGSSYGVREGRFYEWNVSVVKMHIVDVSFGASENYATGGVNIANSIKNELPDFQEIIGLCVLYHNVAGWVAAYNSSTGKLQFFGQEPTNATTGVIALSEMANNSNVINGKTVRVLVFGV